MIPTREQTIAWLESNFESRLWRTANDDYQLRLLSRFEVEAVKAALSKPRPEVALRTKAIAERALTEWAGWYDESRGGTPSEVTDLREELESLWPSQRDAARSDEK